MFRLKIGKRGVETEATQAGWEPVERAGHRPAGVSGRLSVVVHVDRNRERGW